MNASDVSARMFAYLKELLKENPNDVAVTIIAEDHDEYSLAHAYTCPGCLAEVLMDMLQNTMRSYPEFDWGAWMRQHQSETEHTHVVSRGLH